MSTRENKRPGKGKVGKTRKWRMTKKQMVDGKLVRYGRKLRNAMMAMGTTKAFPTPLLITLMKSAGIATPVFDETMKAMGNVVAKSEVEETISESLQVQVPVEGQPA